ncbi:MAG: MBL fold metallo-hydrolase [Roseburia sp.]|nr:MBL fold metallo-hydrolase [Roseburia sp.]
MKKKRLLPALLLLLLVLLCAVIFFLFSAKNKTDSTGYVPDLSKEYLVTQYSDATGQHGTFYTITKDSVLIIIDGGWAGNEAAVREVIAQHGNHVDAWIISHPHKDHAGAFNAIYANPDGITVDKIYDNGFDHDFIAEAGEPYDDIEIMETYYELTKDAANVTHLKRGDVLDICGLTFSVFNAYDDVVLANVGGEKDYQNNASLLLKVSSANSSMLFCSDIKYDMNDTLLASWEAELSCDYVQTGHHGNWSFSDDFYDKTGALVFFMDATSEITDSPNFPASTLKSTLMEKGKTVLDFSTAPNSVTLK